MIHFKRGNLSIRFVTHARRSQRKSTTVHINTLTRVRGTGSLLPKCNVILGTSITPRRIIGK
ncbi:hypothetical protein ACHAXH_008959 [Discostella pseudostelligera]